MLTIQLVITGLAVLIGIAFVFAGVNFYRERHGLPTSGIYSIGSFTGVLTVMALACVIGFIAVGLFTLEYAGS